MKKVVVHVQSASDEQELDKQLQTLRNSPGPEFEFPVSITDDGQPPLLERPILQHLLEDLAHHRVDAVMIDSVNQLARDSRGILGLQSWLQRRGLVLDFAPCHPMFR
jgi:DNA invertase Pin-like site-specific DNA recombinase